MMSQKFPRRSCAEQEHRLIHFGVEQFRNNEHEPHAQPELNDDQQQELDKHFTAFIEALVGYERFRTTGAPLARPIAGGESLQILQKHYQSLSANQKSDFRARMQREVRRAGIRTLSVRDENGMLIWTRLEPTINSEAEARHKAQDKQQIERLEQEFQ